MQLTIENTKDRGKMVEDPSELFLRIIAPKSWTLNLCRDVDNSLLLFQEICQELASWRFQVLSENFVPLSQLSGLSVILGKICRIRIQMTRGVSNLVAEVRSMFLGFDTTDQLCLEREMELVRHDRLLFLEGKIEKLNTDLTNAKLVSRSKRANLGWKHFVTELLNHIEGSRADETQKQIYEFVSSLKRADRKAISERVGQQTVKTKSKQRQISSQEMAPKGDEKRDDVLSSPTQNSKPDLHVWQQKLESDSKAIAEEKRQLQNKREVLLNQQKEFEMSKQQFEVTMHNSKMELISAAQSLAERERLVNARFPELSEIESYVTDLLQKLDQSAKKVLNSVPTVEEVNEIKETSFKSIAYADLKLNMFKADNSETQYNQDNTPLRPQSHGGSQAQNQSTPSKDLTASVQGKNFVTTKSKFDTLVTGVQEASTSDLSLISSDTSHDVENFRVASSPSFDPHFKLTGKQNTISVNQSSANIVSKPSSTIYSTLSIPAKQTSETRDYSSFEGPGEASELLSGSLPTKQDSNIDDAGASKASISTLRTSVSEGLDVLRASLVPAPGPHSTTWIQEDGAPFKNARVDMSDRVESLEQHYRSAIEIENQVENTIAALLESNAQMKEKIRRITAVNEEIESFLVEYRSAKVQLEFQQVVLGNENGQMHPSSFTGYCEGKTPPLNVGVVGDQENSSPEVQNNRLALAFKYRKQITDIKADSNVCDSGINVRQLESTANRDVLPGRNEVLDEDKYVPLAAASAATYSPEAFTFAEMRNENVVPEATTTFSPETVRFDEMRNENIVPEPASRDLNWARLPNPRLSASFSPDDKPQEALGESNPNGRWASRQGGPYSESHPHKNLQNSSQGNFTVVSSSPVSTRLTLAEKDISSAQSKFWNDDHHLKQPFDLKEIFTSKAVGGLQVSRQTDSSETRMISSGVPTNDKALVALSQADGASSLEQNKELALYSELHRDQERTTEFDLKTEVFDQERSRFRRESALGEKTIPESVLRKDIKALPHHGQSITCGIKTETNSVSNILRQKPLKAAVPADASYRVRSFVSPHFKAFGPKSSARKEDTNESDVLEKRRESEFQEMIESSIALEDLKELDTSELILLQNAYRSRISLLETEFVKRQSEDNHLESDGSHAHRASKDKFLREILSDENAVAGEEGSSNVFPLINKDRNVRAAKMAALPAIYLPSLSRFQAKGMPRRVGGGFSSSSAGEPPRYSSAPTGLIEYLSLQGRPLDI